MAHVHDHYGHGSTTVVESDREGPATAFVVLIALVIIGALIWFFAFSGIVLHRGTTSNSPTIIQNPPAQQNNNTYNNPPANTTGAQPSP